MWSDVLRTKADEISLSIVKFQPFQAVCEPTVAGILRGDVTAEVVIVAPSASPPSPLNYGCGIFERETSWNASDSKMCVKTFTAFTHRSFKAFNYACITQRLALTDKLAAKNIAGSARDNVADISFYRFISHILACQELWRRGYRLLQASCERELCINGSKPVHVGAS